VVKNSADFAQLHGPWYNCATSDAGNETREYPTVTPDDKDDREGPPALRLDHFLKLSAGSETGGQAKVLIQGGYVKVNGAVETRRRRKLIVGDVVEVDGRRFTVDEIPSDD
jgi:ribosome-associated protein